MNRRQPVAVIPVHIQADFTELHNGSLAVPGTGQDYIESVIAATREYKQKGLTIVATIDYHPADHVSFFTNHPGAKPFEVIRIGDVEQVLWPPHCVQGSPGGRLLVPRDLITSIVETASDPRFDGYSGFRDDGGRQTKLKQTLLDLGAEKLTIYGLATDYCVRATVLHAREEGFEVTLRLGLCRGIDPEGTRSAVEEMSAAGAVIAE